MVTFTPSTSISVEKLGYAKYSRGYVQQVVAFEHGKNCFRTNQDCPKRGLNKNEKGVSMVPTIGYSDARLDNLAFNFVLENYYKTNALK